MLVVERPGILSTIQDLGRDGMYRFGIPPSGAADRRAHCAANWLVGNDATAATIEITLQGPTLHVEADELLVALCGGDAPLQINGESRPDWTSHMVRRGDEIAIGTMRSQLRGYLAVTGGIDVPLEFESRATYVLGHIGGVDGRALRRGDRLPTAHADVRTGTNVGQAVPLDFRPAPEGPTVEVGFVEGLFSEHLTAESRNALYDGSWHVRPESDRVGYRLTGPTLSFKPRPPAFGAGSGASNVVDAGYPVGCLMVPSEREGILGMWDTVTAGGFATMGALPRVELDRLAQVRPGYAIRFRRISVEATRSLRARHRRDLERLHAACTDLVTSPGRHISQCGS